MKKVNPFLLLALLIIFIWAFFWWAITIDDTFISLRYAHNMATGNGPVFNIGEKTEGCSSPLWIAILALFQRLHCDPLITSKTLGLFSAFCLIILFFITLRSTLQSGFLAGLATVWFAVLPGIHVYAVSGMETLLFACAVAGAVSIPVLPFSTQTKQIFIPAGLLVVITLRPEGLLLFIVLTLYWLYTEKSKNIIGLSISVLIAAGLFFTRFYYYHAWFPNTFSAKPSPIGTMLKTIPFPNVALVLIKYGITHETLQSVVSSLGGVGLLFCIGFLFITKHKSKIVQTSLVAVCTGFIFIYYAPYDWMPANRFALPFIYPFLLLAVIGFDILFGFIPNKYVKFSYCLLGIILILHSVKQLQTTQIMLHEIAQNKGNNALNAEQYAEMGKWLCSNSKPSDKILAYEIGAVGYYSGRYIIDHEGLISSPIASIIQKAGGYGPVRRGYDEKAMNAIVHHCMEQNPDWFLLHTVTRKPLVIGQPIPHDIESERIQYALFEKLEKTMILARVFQMRKCNKDDKYLVLRKR